MVQKLLTPLLQVTEIKLSCHNKVKPSERRKIDGSQSAYDLLLEAWDRTRIELVEECKLLMLDRIGACIGLSTIATGGVAGCLINTKIVIAAALKARASDIILAHNHPSGSLSPSKPDDAMTERLCEASRLLDIRFIDHLIVTPYDYYSYADNGLIP